MVCHLAKDNYKKYQEPITIRLANKELSGPDELMLTKPHINKLKKA